MSIIRKGQQCLECFHNKTKIIRNEDDLLKWLTEKGWKSKVPSRWINKIIDDGHIQFFWCTEQKPFRPIINILCHGKNYKRVICPKISK